MSPLWSAAGRLSFWITWPLIIIYLFNSRRTRVLIRHGEDIVVTKAWLGDGKWSLPGGGLHKKETPLIGMQRELYEETGIDLKDNELSLIGEYNFAHHGLRFKYYLFVVQANHRYSLKRQHFEIAKTAWVNGSELSARNARPDVLEALQAWSS